MMESDRYKTYISILDKVQREFCLAIMLLNIPPLDIFINIIGYKFALQESGELKHYHVDTVRL